MQCIKKFVCTIHYSYRNFNKINVLHKRNGVLTQIVIQRHRSDYDSVPKELDMEDPYEKEELNQMSEEYLGTATDGHRVFVLQPYIKWGPDKKRNTTPELQLAEAVALVKTLPNWVVVGTKCVPLLTLSKKKLLGSGNLETLKKEVQSSEHVTAIFVSTNILKYYQLNELKCIFGLPIFDRYSIVIHIFRQHAKTPEAKLQVALAEVPYFRKTLNEMTDHRGGRINLAERRKKILESHERRLQKALQQLQVHRQLLRNQRRKLEFPTVAVVGYTNAGKTSLIKALTEDKVLQPKNKLFATLDTTIHEGILPSTLKVLYVDTIGFIQDVPQGLIEPFKVTLEDAMIADIIVHVYDISHPDMEAQVEHVQETIKPMIDENKLIINVANKCDVVENLSIPEGTIGVSSKNLTGIDILRLKLDKEILAATGRVKTRVRVGSGSIEAAWLYKETTVIHVDADPKNPQYLLMDVIATPITFHKFRRFLKK